MRASTRVNHSNVGAIVRGIIRRVGVKSKIKTIRERIV